MPSARVFGPWPEHSNPAASCLQWSCALQAEAVDTFFFFACAHLTRGRCCTSDLIAPLNAVSVLSKIERNKCLTCNVIVRVIRSTNQIFDLLLTHTNPNLRKFATLRRCTD